VPAPPLFSSEKSCMSATVAGWIYLKSAGQTSPPPFSGVLKAPHPLCFLFFSVPYLAFFFPRLGSDCSGSYAGFIQGLAVGIPCAAYLLICWSMSQKQVRIWCLVAREPSLFLSVIWHGEAMCGMGV
jgi:hypothetical protein